MKNLTIKTILLLLFTPICEAHAGVSINNGLLQGFLHPLTGFDHLFTIIAFGMLASRQNQTEKLVLPFVFLCSMIIGFCISMSNLPLGISEKIIATSMIMFGIWLGFDNQVNNRLLLIIVSCSSIAHGYAHGIEMTGSPMHYFSGFISSAFLLMLVTLLTFRYASPVINKLHSLFGMVIAALGLFYLIQV
ncbi:MAG: HupE/UreJ family protein [Methylococcales bacterium]|nr:HupE/UreJ family protein [Methylococcales bacterium]